MALRLASMLMVMMMMMMEEEKVTIWVPHRPERLAVTPLVRQLFSSSVLAPHLPSSARGTGNGPLLSSCPAAAAVGDVASPAAYSGCSALDAGGCCSSSPVLAAHWRACALNSASLIAASRMRALQASPCP